MMMSTTTTTTTMIVVMVMVMTVRQVTSSQPSVSVGAANFLGTTVQVGDSTVDQYLGVRYAQPPVGDLRFSRPLASEPPSGQVNASSFSPSCPGILNVLPMDEDCLFLNVYVPPGSPQAPNDGFPVMMWIYGGGFLFGEASLYDGSLLAAEGRVIVVTHNYRVGPLGFLSTGDNSSVGNYGLWDQLLALKWVRQNIGHFGGDVKRITLLGESAGAASVSFHMTSPHSRGLFHRAILQSGSRMVSWGLNKEPWKSAQLIATVASCSDVANSGALVTCLRGKPWQALRVIPIGAPVVDGDFVLPLSQAPTFEGSFIVGINNREGKMLFHEAPKPDLDYTKKDNYYSVLMLNMAAMYPSLMLNATQTAKAQAMRLLDCVYRKQGDVGSDVTFHELEAVTGDVQIVLGSQQFLDAVKASGDRYLYYFDHSPDNLDEEGMDHAMDIAYTFGFRRGLWASYSPFANVTMSDRDQLLAKRYRSLLTSFAYSGHPSVTGSRSGWPTWPPYVKGEQASYLSLTFSPRVAARLNADLRTVWEETVPGVLSSRGMPGLADTRWAHCAEQTSDGPPPLRPTALCWIVLGTMMRSTKTTMIVVVMMMMTVNVNPVSSAQPSVSVGGATLWGITVPVGNTTVDQYLGVRYAQPPVGDLRFSRPLASDPPSGQVNASSFPPTCPGILNILPMAEDCLFLNVYVPRGSSRFPVMFWIYGGRFLYGAGSQYDGSLLAAEGRVIVVTPNYRVGPLGFLSTGDNYSAGNYGLWDQLLALKWVRRNIGHFGGDVTRITLFGNSAGAASVSFHMTSPHSQGLFHRAILQSGSREAPWALNKEPFESAQRLAIALNCTNVVYSKAIVECLRAVPWEALTLPFGAPVLDGDFIVLMNRAPMFNGSFIVGINNREGRSLYRGAAKQNPVDYTQSGHYSRFLGLSLLAVHPLPTMTATPHARAKALRLLDCVYRKQGAIGSDVTLRELEAVTGDVQIVLDCQQFLDMAKASGKRYLYYFNHTPDNVQEEGMDHAMDVGYTFGFTRTLWFAYSIFANITISDRDELLAKHFRSLLTNFAHSGNPNTNPRNERRPSGWPTWPPYVKGEQASYLSLTFSPRVAARLNADLRTVWEETVPEVLNGYRGVASLSDTQLAHCEPQAEPVLSGASPAALLPAVICVMGAILLAVLL